MRVCTFPYIVNLLCNNHTRDDIKLYNLKEKKEFSLFDGDYGLQKIYNEFYCLLGLKSTEVDKITNITQCVPQSWMASERPNKLVKNKRPMYIKSISRIPRELFNDKMLLEHV